MVKNGFAPLTCPHFLAVNLARQLAHNLRQNPKLLLTQKTLMAHIEPLLLPGPKQVLNGTGIMLHTNLGRAPLSRTIFESAFAQVERYTDLEMNLETGKRGHRDRSFSKLAQRLWQVEDATLVNNAAAAVALSLAALSPGQETIISRSELIEIGGSFRMPDIMSFAGTRLKEVGTTNKTKVEDYKNAISAQTGCLFKAHPSNYRIQGFTTETPLQELCDLGKKHRIPVIMDLGSGLSQRTNLASGGEPTIEECLQANPDVLIFSGDKLLGGSQSGIILGSHSAIQAIRAHTMMRMVRVDKLTHALTCHQLSHIARHQPFPLSELASVTPEQLTIRAKSILEKLPDKGFTIVPSKAFMGGGSMPGTERESTSIIHPHPKPAFIAQKARTGAPALMGHIQKNKFHINLATIFPEQDPALTIILKELTNL